MNDYYITQTELANIVGVSKNHINRLKAKGIFDSCFDGKRLVRELSIKTFNEYKQDNQRDNKSVEANIKSLDKDYLIDALINNMIILPSKMAQRLIYINSENEIKKTLRVKLQKYFFKLVLIPIKWDTSQKNQKVLLEIILYGYYRARKKARDRNFELGELLLIDD